MTEEPKKLVLGLAMNPLGPNLVGWRMPDSGVEACYTIEPFIESVKLAEAAKMHLMFAGDSADHYEATIEKRPKRLLESFSVMSALSSVTKNIGLICTFSTSFTHPYNVCRQMCALDHISKGRAGWNMVTSYGGAEHFSGDPLDSRAARHERAKEYADIVEMLFNSWDDDTLIRDRATGRFLDKSKIRTETYAGKSLHVTGPLNMPRPPQGRPVIFQAGQSDHSNEFAARYADLVYVLHPTKELGIAHYQDIKSRLAKYGRKQSDLKVMPGCCPILGETEADAAHLFKNIGDLIDISQERNVLQKWMVGIPLHKFADDDVIPASIFKDVDHLQNNISHYSFYKYLSIEKRMSIRQIIQARSMGETHWVPMGSAENVADQLIDRFESGACDGFNLAGVYQPVGTHRITKLLVPMLQQKGYFRTEYEGATLRENLGLERPRTPVN